MRFRQLDRIVELRPGDRIVAERTVSDDDRYFMDHFPEFHVVPGALTLEAMYQACDWLVRKTDEFSRSAVLLQSVRAVKYSGMVRPGDLLSVHAVIKKRDESSASFFATATVSDTTVAQARITVDRFNLADRYPDRAASDPYLMGRKQEQYDLLTRRACDIVPASPTHFRWMWIDRFTEFVSGRHARSIKSVSLADEPVDLYLPGCPVLPCSLVVEGFALTAGLLVSEIKRYEEQVVLAKISRAVFHRPALAGDRIEYSVEIVDVGPEGAMIRGQSHIDQQLHSEIEFFIAYLGRESRFPEMVQPVELLRLARIYGLYEVARDAQGAPLAIPARMLDAEKMAGTDR